MAGATETLLVSALSCRRLGGRHPILRTRQRCTSKTSDSLWTHRRTEAAAKLPPRLLERQEFRWSRPRPAHLQRKPLQPNWQECRRRWVSEQLLGANVWGPRSPRVFPSQTPPGGPGEDLRRPPSVPGRWKGRVMLVTHTRTFSVPSVPVPLSSGFPAGWQQGRGPPSLRPRPLGHPQAAVSSIGGHTGLMFPFLGANRCRSGAVVIV